MAKLDGLEFLEVHTGNIHVGGKAKVPSTSTAKDLFKSVVKTLKSKVQSLEGVQGQGEVFGETCRPLSQDEILQHSFTVKVFLLQWEPEYVKQAVHAAFNEFGLTSVNYVIIQFPPPVIGGEVPMESVKCVWKVVEGLVRAGSASVVGVADLNKDQLNSLHSWAEIKPSINQVNLEACCEIPPDLVAFSKEADIQLNSHNDDSNILPRDAFATCLESAGVAKEQAARWEPVWAVKYNSQIKTRNILGHRGFIVAGRK